MHTDWIQLADKCSSCTQCDLCKTRQHVVFGIGNPNAEVLFIGEAPGQHEDETGQPFIGRSGKLLDSYLQSIGLHRDKNIFIANIVKCRPPNNRDPLPAEREICLPWLQEQIRLMQPKIIICLGRIAAQVIIRSNFAMMKEHGQWIEKQGCFYMGMLHPAALLRNPHNKPLAQDDFTALQEKITQICTHTYTE